MSSLDVRSSSRTRTRRAYTRPLALVAALFLGLLVLAGCSTAESDETSAPKDEATTTTAAPIHNDSHDGHDLEDTEATQEGPRTITVKMDDDMSYAPGEIEMTAGETAVFEVENAGKIRHELVIGDEHAQEEAEKAMASGTMDMESEGSAHAHEGTESISLDAGESGTLSYTAGEAGTVLIGCHEPGHYGAGMQATIAIT